MAYGDMQTDRLTDKSTGRKTDRDRDIQPEKIKKDVSVTWRRCHSTATVPLNDLSLAMTSYGHLSNYFTRQSQDHCHYSHAWPALWHHFI